MESLKTMIENRQKELDRLLSDEWRYFAGPRADQITDTTEATIATLKREIATLKAAMRPSQP